ncbi:hypothetical protein ACSVH5_02005 [Flavobacterium sp. RSSA_27]|uniref:hypothetical protein n=1 Tax=Flavobacterium sp. RSSA_27 TaxID=3447667 RepID=UPI003F40C4F0
MKITYLLDCYDTVFRQTTTSSISKETLFEALKPFENNSFRVFEIEIQNNSVENSIKINKTIHSLHPEIQPLELKSIFHFEEYLDYIPKLNALVKFKGKTIYLAKHLTDSNIFYVCEKCPINAIPARERNLLYTHQVLKNGNLTIKRAIKEKVFKSRSNVKIQHFIQKTQQALECQLHQLIKVIAPKNKSELYEYSSEYNKIDCYKCQFYHLEKLLIFLKCEYEEYLNDKLMVPYRTILKDEVELTAKIQFVRNSLLAMEINKELLKLLFDPILKLNTLELKDKISYYQYNYAKNYVLELAHCLATNSTDFTQLEWCNWLMMMRVNTFQCFDFITAQLKKEFSNCVSENEKLDLLFDYLKIYNQFKTNQATSYQENLPEIHFQIYTWLEEEIAFLSRKKEVAKLIENQNEYSGFVDKIHVDFSVAQLACFVDLLIKAGIIKNNNRKEVLQVVAQTVKTDMTETISVDSLRSKCYNIETSTSEAVAKKIEKILELTKG